ncbi:MAG: oxygen-independent coproporphyrinogen III oxidase [Alphaproteobacteria bacterium]|nr:oxygen-independent coproporphyrinogen III oxidase [Alphaproteobacteria bacterium]
MQASTALWLGKPAPRYTSYPPAPFFHAEAGAADYRRSLQEIPAGQAVSVYIHIPFCRHLCLYCGCNTLITNRPQRIHAYMEALKREISLVAAITGRRALSSLHFGGGTPNALPASDMLGLFEHLRAQFDFSAIREIAMELDPRLASREQVANLAACGVTRVSLGVQDFDPGVQAAIGRVQPYEMVAALCAQLRAAGIHHINFDLLYGLPRQTVGILTDTCRRAADLSPDRIALFAYAHVPALKKHQKALEPHGIPDMGQRLAMDQAARGILVSRGYEAIGIDHFARYGDSLAQAWRAGHLHRGFQGYMEEAGTLLGFGASSISQTEAGYFQNERDERAYQSAVAGGDLPVHRGFLLSREDRVRRAIIGQLMCSLSCDIEAICRAFDYPVETFAATLEKMKPFEKGGIVARDGYALCLTTPHRMAVRVICSLFDAYTPGSPMLASRAA